MERGAIRRIFQALAARRIVTKGFAVILDLICMLMVMDVYLLLFPGFVAAACYPATSLGQRSRDDDDDGEIVREKKCRWPLMPHQKQSHLRSSLQRDVAATGSRVAVH